MWVFSKLESLRQESLKCDSVKSVLRVDFSTQLHSLFLNAERLVEKYFCNQDIVIAVYLQNKILNLRILLGSFPDNPARINFSSTDGS